MNSNFAQWDSSPSIHHLVGYIVLFHFFQGIEEQANPSSATVGGSDILHQLRVQVGSWVVETHYLQGFKHPNSGWPCDF